MGKCGGGKMDTSLEVSKWRKRSIQLACKHELEGLSNILYILKTQSINRTKTYSKNNYNLENNKS